MLSGRSAVARSSIAQVLLTWAALPLTQCHNHASLGVWVASAQAWTAAQISSRPQPAFATAPITPPPQHRVRFSVGAHCLRRLRRRSPFAPVARYAPLPPLPQAPGQVAPLLAPFAQSTSCLSRCAQQSALMLGLFKNGLACLTLPLRPFGNPTNPHTRIGRSKTKGRLGGLWCGLSSAPRSFVRGLRQTFNALLRCGLPCFALPHPAPCTLNFS
jgi:hypothetical protein